MGDDAKCLAARYGHPATVQFLSKPEGDRTISYLKLIKKKNKGEKEQKKVGGAVLHQAFVAIKADRPKELLSILPDLYEGVVLTEVNMPPLLYGCTVGAVGCVECMLMYGWINFKCHPSNGWSPFLCAASEGHTNIIRLLNAWGLVSSGGYKNQGESAIHLAAKNGHVRTVGELLEQGGGCEYQPSDHGGAAYPRGDFWDADPPS